MTEAVTLQLIGLASAITTALITVGVPALVILANRTRQHARAASNNTAQTRDQVTNDHQVNLRDDLDQKFAKIDRQFATQSRQINRLFRNDREIKDEIEHTLTKPALRSYKPKE